MNLAEGPPISWSSATCPKTPGRCIIKFVANMPGCRSSRDGGRLWPKAGRARGLSAAAQASLFVLSCFGACLELRWRAPPTEQLQEVGRTALRKTVDA
jgi:hypothetical protein